MAFDNAALADELINNPSYGALAPGSLPADKWNTASVSGYQPAYLGGTDTTGVGGFSGANLTKALQGLNQGAAAAANKGGAQPQMGGMQMTPVGRPSSPVSLDQLVKMLEQRRMALMAGGNGQPQAAPTHVGLLGF